MIPDKPPREEPKIQCIVLQDAYAVLGGAIPVSQQHYVTSIQRIFDRLIHNGMVVRSNHTHWRVWSVGA
ncbi:hypothetical protein [Budvicia diplopodorum]|uniref:hypothetical protein n=1 Tax=Budvicia diplopodorum TaxID=1119056 RepID=UPI0031B5CAA4